MKPFSVSLTVFTTFFLLLTSTIYKVNSAEVLSFNFPKFTSGDPSITLQGSSKILPNGVLALTPRPNPTWNTGRALYAKPIHLWDKATGNVASFVTSFTFVVENLLGPSYNTADGIIIFLAPTGTKIPSNSNGGNLGIVDGNNAFNQFVGVEFDSYSNEWDPNHPHIGIDVNSLLSLKIVKWNRISRALVTVSITYESSSKVLRVSLGTENGGVSTVSQAVDLRDVLPEKVQIGFSATTTSGGVEAHDIHSWSFTSILKTSTGSSATDEKIMNIASYA